MTTIAGKLLGQVNKLLQVVDDQQGEGLTFDEFQRLNELASSVWGLLGIFRNGKFRYDVRGWCSNMQTGIRINYCEDDNPFYCWIAADTSAANSKWRQLMMSVRAAAQAVVEAQAFWLNSQLAIEKTTRPSPASEVDACRGSPTTNQPHLECEAGMYSLYYGAAKLHVFKGGRKTRQLPFLQEFQNAGWPAALQSSLKPKLLQRTVIDLNRTLRGKALRFRVDEHGRATWLVERPH